jgi:hypothetical protein
MGQRAATPKKETARITLPPEGAGKQPLPKATVKMQQTQPLVNRPAPSLTPVAPMTQAHMTSGGGAADDSAMNLMSIAALVVSVISLALVYFAYAAASA